MKVLVMLLMVLVSCGGVKETFRVNVEYSIENTECKRSIVNPENCACHEKYHDKNRAILFITECNKVSEHGISIVE